jgi:hypothetical protein
MGYNNVVSLNILSLNVPALKNMASRMLKTMVANSEIHLLSYHTVYQRTECSGTKISVTHRVLYRFPIQICNESALSRAGLIFFASRS